ALKARLRARRDQRIGSDGVVTIKAQEHRSLPRNRAAALERLRALITAAATLPRRRIATAPTAASRERRLAEKGHKARLKAGRGSASRDE
ncbi:MAG TPA: aminoacyl-tRNA hydrolase, partial [Burkholderiaceae bacterium]|nr:aminoacyl-tRNA hydrolase [Burkholderiaceae bacterium]